MRVLSDEFTRFVLELLELYFFWVSFDLGKKKTLTKIINGNDVNFVGVFRFPIGSNKVE